MTPNEESPQAGDESTDPIDETPQLKDRTPAPENTTSDSAKTQTESLSEPVEPEGSSREVASPTALSQLRDPRLRKAAVIAAGLVLVLLGLLLGVWISPSAPAESTGDAQAEAKDAAPTTWTCSMHPQIQSPNPGSCPICGMDLIPVTAGGDDLGPRELKLSPAAMSLAEIETEPVRRRHVDREVRMVGKVDFDETRLNYITAWVGGRLDRLFVDYTGTPVREGDHLVEIYSPQLLSAQEELLQAIRASDSGVGGSELLRDSTRRTVESSREKLRLWGLAPDQIAAIESTGKIAEHITIRAPVGGVVVHKNKNTGDYVKTGERVYTIADLTQVWVQLDAYESDLPWIRYGQTVGFEVEAFPGVRFEGRVVFVDPVLTAQTRTVRVRLNVDNKAGRLKPGMFVRATLRARLEAGGQTLDPSVSGKWICPMHGDVIKDEPGACDLCGMPLVKAESLYQAGDQNTLPPLAVPATAVLWTGKRSLVYVRKPGDVPIFAGQEVVLGPRAGAYYVVTEGLEEGQLVVTRGSFKIDSALQIEARPSMMLPSDDPPTPTRYEVSEEFLGALDPVFERYLEVQTALAADDLSTAKGSALGEAVREVNMRLVSGPGHVSWMGLAKTLRDGAAALSEAGDLDEGRAAFGEISRAMLEVERQFGHLAGEFREAFCPMAFDNTGASWIQRDAEIANPYFGASMLSCGEIREVFPAHAASGESAAKTGHEDHGPSNNHEGHRKAPANNPEGHRQPPDAGPPGDVDTPATVPDSAKRELDQVLIAYFAIQTELASDRTVSAIQLAATQDGVVRAKLEALSAQELETWRGVHVPALVAALEGLKKVRSLDEQRTAFEALSSSVQALVEHFGHLSERSVRRFRCPMAFDNRGADWLQEGPQTLNPYFGSGMLRCGSEVEVLPEAGSAEREGGNR